MTATDPAATLAAFRLELATAPLGAPPGREWMFRLADALETVLAAQEGGLSGNSG